MEFDRSVPVVWLFRLLLSRGTRQAVLLLMIEYAVTRMVVFQSKLSSFQSFKKSIKTNLPFTNNFVLIARLFALLLAGFYSPLFCRKSPAGAGL